MIAVGNSECYWTVNYAPSREFKIACSGNNVILLYFKSP